MLVEGTEKSYYHLQPYYPYQTYGDLAFWRYLLGAAGDNGMDMHWTPLDAGVTGTASLGGVCSVEGFIGYFERRENGTRMSAKTRF